MSSQAEINKPTGTEVQEVLRLDISSTKIVDSDEIEFAPRGKTFVIAINQDDGDSRFLEKTGDFPICVLGVFRRQDRASISSADLTGCPDNSKRNSKMPRSSQTKFATQVLSKTIE